jgi:hypothetical protein
LIAITSTLAKSDATIANLVQTQRDTTLDTHEITRKTSNISSAAPSGGSNLIPTDSKLE